MNAPVMRADSVARIRTLDEAAAAIAAAVANTAKVVPPVAATWMAAELTRAASIDAVRAMSWQCLDHWLELADEINGYAARATERVEVEAFLDGTSPDDAAFTARFDTDQPEKALGSGVWDGAGVAHRSVIYLHGPWIIDRPAREAVA